MLLGLVEDIEDQVPHVLDRAGDRGQLGGCGVLVAAGPPVNTSENVAWRSAGPTDTSRKSMPGAAPRVDVGASDGEAPAVGPGPWI